MEAQLRRRLHDAGNPGCRLGGARVHRGMEQRRLALDRGRGAHSSELALYSDRYHADQQQIEGHWRERRRTDVSRVARVVGTAARGSYGARPCRNPFISLSRLALKHRLENVDSPLTGPARASAI